MKIEINNNSKDFDSKIDSGKIKFIIPFSISFITKNKTLLKDTEIKLRSKKVKFETKLIENLQEPMNELKYPHLLMKDDGNKKVLFLSIDFIDLLDINKTYELEIHFKFEYNDESESESIYVIEFIKSSDKQVSLENVRKYYGWQRYVSLSLLALTLLMVFLWNMSNYDVFNQSKYLTAEKVNVLLTLVIIFLGINLSSLKIFFNQLDGVFHFLKYLEFYISPLLMKLSRNIIFLIVMIIFTLLSFDLLYSYYPVEIAKFDNYTYYCDGQEINTNRVFKKYLNKIKVGLNKYLLYNKNIIISLGNVSCESIKDLLFGTAHINFNVFKLYNNCDLVNNKTEPSEYFNIQQIIYNRKNQEDSLIFDRIRGICNDAIYDSVDMHFCINKGIPPTDTNEFDKDRVISALEDNHNAKINTAREVWNDINNPSKFYSDLQDEYLFQDELKNIFKELRPTDYDIHRCYEAIVNYTNQNKIQPFYDGDQQNTFDKILKVIALFNGAVDNLYKVELNKIILDFDKYLERKKGDKQISGINSLDIRIIVLYSNLLCYLQRISYDNIKSDEVFFTDMNGIMQRSIQREAQLKGDDKTNEISKRNRLIRNIFIECARFDLTITKNLSDFFYNNKNAFAGITEDELYIKNMEGYKRYKQLFDKLR